MLQNKFIFFIALCTILVFSGCSLKNEQLNHRLIYNSDGSNVLWNSLFPGKLLTEDDVKVYVDLVANTQVTTFMMCSGSDFFYYRSKYGRPFGDDLNETLDCGCDTAKYKNMLTSYANFLNLEKEGTDIISTSLRRAKEKGMEAFITYRMNDIHFNDTSLHCPVVYTDFWLAHPEFWLNEKVGWHSRGAFDFAHEEVRNHKLNIITEQLEKYEMIDGYDLDFLRFMVYFKSADGKKNAPLMTDLVKAVKEKVDELSKKREKKILLSARIPPDIDFCLEKGLDVKEWLRLGLLDFVTISIHFTGTPALPVTKFKSDLNEPYIPIYTALEQGGYNPREQYSHGMFRGMASHNLAQGSDGNYMFNYFFSEYFSKYNEQLHLEDGGYSSRIIMPELLNELGALETLSKRNKIYCMDNGTSAFWGYNPKTPLPLVLSPENNSTVTIFIGDDTKKNVPEESVLFLRTDRPARFRIKVNGKLVKTQKTEYAKLYNRDTNLEEKQNIDAWILPASCLEQGENEISILSLTDTVVTVKRLEIAIKYGDVKTKGYF